MALLAALPQAGCDGPAEVRKGALVRTLYEQAGPPGRYIVYWNGKDEDGKTVAAGDYVCYLDAGTDLQAINLTALNGTGGRRADTLGAGAGWVYLPTQPVLYNLDPAVPNPFYNRDGTNLFFEISGSGYAVVSIHRKP
jgi:hypothetical protein